MEDICDQEYVAGEMIPAAINMFIPDLCLHTIVNPNDTV